MPISGHILETLICCAIRCIRWLTKKSKRSDHCLDAPVVVVIKVLNQFMLEVLHGRERLKVEKLTLEQSEEMLDHSIVKAVAFSAPTLRNVKAS